MFAIQASDVTKVYPIHRLAWLQPGRRRTGEIVALSSISLSVAPGEIVCVAGETGSGKSTLLKVLAARLQPTRGSVSVYGRDTGREGAAARRLVSYVSYVSWHSLHLNPGKSGIANLISGWREPGAGKEVMPSRVEEAVELLALQGAIHHPVRAYSAGMLRRLAIARSILAGSRVLVADDLFSGLDAGGYAAVRSLLSRYAHEDGGTVIFSALRAEEGGQLADTVAILAQGRLQSVGLAPEVLSGQAPPRFLVRLRGPSSVVLSAVGTTEPALAERDGEDTVTAEVQIEGESAFLALMRDLLCQGEPPASAQFPEQ